MRTFSVDLNAGGDTRYVAYFDGVRFPFGYGMCFLDHHNADRRKRWLDRHQHEEWNNPISEEALVRWIMWEENTLPRAVAAYADRFGYKVVGPPNPQHADDAPRRR